MTRYLLLTPDKKTQVYLRVVFYLVVKYLNKTVPDITLVISSREKTYTFMAKLYVYMMRINSLVNFVLKMALY